MAELSTFISALDAKHAEARLAFERKNLLDYTAIFSPNLRYHQIDGRIIGRDQLMQDVRSQFRRLSHVRSSFAREQIDVLDDRVTEVLIQTASASVTAFLVVHKTWAIFRKGQYTWKKNDIGWQIDEVFVIEENVTSLGFQYGLRPKPAG
jgi:hypothetical protein